MTESDLKAKLDSLAPNETFDLSDRAFAEIFPGGSDTHAREALWHIATRLECLFENGGSEHTVRFIKVAREPISESDRKAIDLYYEYTGSEVHRLYPRSDVDRRRWMDSKDWYKKENVPLIAGLVGFGAAAVLLTPFGWIGGAGVAAAFGFNKLKREWRKERTLAAYGRTFIFDRKGAVIWATIDSGFGRSVSHNT
ncbi:hypothetical protein [Bradyrhizobium genosp. P]|uniref:hypothetical protein n=1 Tax=Bradyrhizobium genosp. P TaxID=83641 RepID=UPI003CE94BFC